MAEDSASNLKRFGLPNLGAKIPLVVSVAANSPAHNAGLKPGDLIYQINGKKIFKIPQIRKTIKTGTNRFNVLRYHPGYDSYLLIALNLFL